MFWARLRCRFGGDQRRDTGRQPTATPKMAFGTGSGVTLKSVTGSTGLQNEGLNMLRATWNPLKQCRLPMRLLCVPYFQETSGTHRFCGPDLFEGKGRSIAKPMIKYSSCVLITPRLWLLVAIFSVLTHAADNNSFTPQERASAKALDDDLAKQCHTDQDQCRHAYQSVVIVQKHVTWRMFRSSIRHGHGDAEETGAAGRFVDGQ